MTAGQGIEPVPHLWRASTVTAAGSTPSQVPRVSCASFSTNLAEVNSSLERKNTRVPELMN